MTVKLLPLVSVLHPTNVAPAVDGGHEPILFDRFSSKVDSQSDLVAGTFLNTHDRRPRLMRQRRFVVAVNSDDPIQIARNPYHFAQAVAVQWIEVKSVHVCVS